MVKRALENKDPVKSVLQDDAPQELRDGNEEASRREDRWRALLSVVPPLDSQGSEEGLQKLPPCRALLETSKPDEIVSGSRDRNLEDEQHPRKKLAADGEAAASIANSSSRSRNSVGIDSRTESDNQDVDDTARELSNGNSAGHGNASSSKQKRASYACNLCGSSFAEKYNLNKHVRTVHEKKRPFSCDICPVTFKQKDHLKKHVMTVHEQKRPFICHLCEATFGWVSVLNKHIRSVHEKKRPFECPICHYSFQQKLHLDKHLEAAHQESEDPRTD